MHEARAALRAPRRAVPSQAGDEPSALEALNVFERRDGRWLMIHHGAGPVFVGSKPE